MFKKRSASSGHTSEFSRVYPDGELICQEGESSAEMFVIQSGKVRIYKQAQHSTVELAVLEKGDFFGEMSVLESLPRDASAQAVGETQVLVMSAGALLVRLRRDPTFAFELLHRLSGRVRGLNARLMAALERVSPSVHRTLESPAVGSMLYHPETPDTGAVLPSPPGVEQAAANAAPDTNAALPSTQAQPFSSEPATRPNSTLPFPSAAGEGSVPPESAVPSTAIATSTAPKPVASKRTGTEKTLESPVMPDLKGTARRRGPSA